MIGVGASPRAPRAATGFAKSPNCSRAVSNTDPRSQLGDFALPLAAAEASRTPFLHSAPEIPCHSANWSLQARPI